MKKILSKLINSESILNKKDTENTKISQKIQKEKEETRKRLLNNYLVDLNRIDSSKEKREG